MGDVDEFTRRLADVGERSLTVAERAMNGEIEDKASLDSANLYRGDCEIRRKALERALLAKYTAHYTRILDSGIVDHLLPIMKQIHIQEDMQDEVKKSKYMFITFSPQELSLNPFTFIKYVNKFVKLSYIKEYLYVLEQRYSGVPDDKYKKLGDGIHVHLLINKEEHKFSHVKRDAARVFKDMICNIDLKNIRPTDLEKVKGYMLDKKADEFKQVKQEQDKIWRNDQGIQMYYGIEFKANLD